MPSVTVPVTFQDCVRVIFTTFKLPMPVESYMNDLFLMNEAAVLWHRERAPNIGACLFNVPDLCETVLIGNLDLADSLGLLGNDAARDFVRWIDTQTNYHGTLFMLQILLTLQMAIGPQVNSAGGSS